MKYCMYRTGDAPEVRMGAAAPWSDEIIVDVHRAEVALLAGRTTSRRAHEVAEHLVPAAPSAFLTAGGHVWEFARQAVLATEAAQTTPRGEPVCLAASSCVRLPVVEQLLSTGELVASPAPFSAGSPTTARIPVVAIVRSHAHAVSVEGAWESVAAYVDVAAAPTALVAADVLPRDDLRRAIAHAVSENSRAAVLLPGDLVCSAGVIDGLRASAFEELLLTA